MTRILSVRAALLLVLCIGCAPASAQPAGRPEASVLDDPLVRFQAKRGLDLLYDMKFEQALGLFEQIDRRHPEHPIGPFLKALNTWWKILLDLSDTSHDEAFFGAMEEVVERSERLLERDPDHFDAMFFKGAALGFQGRLKSNRGRWLPAARDGLRAMDYVLGVAERAPKNDDYVFGKGIYDYYAAVIPQRYPYVKPVMIFFPKGDRERGLRELHRTAEQGYYIRTEAVYYLLQIYYIFEQDYDQSVRHVTWLREQHPNNPFFHTFEGRIYARWGRWDEARRIFESVYDRYRAGRSGYNTAAAEQALYYLARTDMMNRRFEEAMEKLLTLEKLAARTTGDTYFKVLGRLRQGMIHDALGRRGDAVSRYHEVLQMKDWAGAHERARRYLDAPYRF